MEEAGVAGHEEFVGREGFAVGEEVDGEGEVGGEGDGGCVGVGCSVIGDGGWWVELMDVAAAAAWETWWARCGLLDGDCAEDSFFPSEGEDYVVEMVVFHHEFHSEPDAPDEESRGHGGVGHDLDFIVVGNSVRLGWMLLGEISIGDLAHEV